MVSNLNLKDENNDLSQNIFKSGSLSKILVHEQSMIQAKYVEEEFKSYGIDE